MSWDILPKGNLQYFLQKLKGKLDLKVDAVSGKGLSTNDFTTTEKNKLAGIEAGAQVNPTIDSALSDSSTNAVQNKIVKAALDGKADSEEVPTVNNNTITIQLNGTTVETFTLNQNTDETINIQVTKSSVGLGNVPNVGTNDQTPTFTQANTRANIASEEKLSIIFGKIMKWFADLKTVAFSGSYTDLTNKPTIPAAVAVKGNAESTYRTGNVNITPANIGLGNVNNTADSSKNVNSANNLNYTKSTSEGTITYPCKVEGELSNSEDKIPNSAAVVNYLNSNLSWKSLVSSTHKPIVGQQQTIATRTNISNIHEVLVEFMYAGVYRQSIVYSKEMLQNDLAFPDFCFASARLYFSLKASADGNQLITSAAGSSGSIGWTQDAYVGFFYR